MRLIDAEQMKNKLKEWVDATGCDVFTKHHIMEFLNDCDAVEAVPVVHGEWIEVDNAYFFSVRCSKCDSLEEFKTNFCPNCGAKMDGKVV